MNRIHRYTLTVEWTGNQGSGTSQYTTYNRNHSIEGAGKTTIPGSSDPAFRGDRTRYNPEELLVASLSSCHMLWYLHLCAEAGVVVTAYTDQPAGVMTEAANGGGHFSDVTLHPTVTVADATMVESANALHEQAHRLCFIANSVNFPVHHQPVCQVRQSAS